MILEEETYEKFGYYSHDLSPHSSKKIIVACDDCGKIRIIAKQGYRSLCQSCANKGIKKSVLFIEEAKKRCKKEKNPHWKGGIDKHICQECHKEFEKYFSDIKKDAKIFCSRECYTKWQSKQIKEKCRFWKGGKNKQICPQCGVIFFAYSSDKKIFCTRECTNKWRSENKAVRKHLREIGRKQKPPTKPELVFKQICEKYNLPFKYTGDGSFWIGKNPSLNPDFMECNGKKIVVEIFGDYWHSPLLNYQLREEGTLYYRQKHYKRYGWKSIFLWETDLLRKDAEQFILTELKKQGIIL